MAPLSEPEDLPSLIDATDDDLAAAWACLPSRLRPFGGMVRSALAGILYERQAAAQRAQQGIPANTEGPILLTAEEIALTLRVSKMSVYRLIHAGAWETVKVGKQFRVVQRSFTTWLLDGGFQEPLAAPSTVFERPPGNIYVVPEGSLDPEPAGSSISMLGTLVGESNALLRSRCRELGIKGFSKMNRHDLLQAVDERLRGVG